MIEVPPMKDIKSMSTEELKAYKDLCDKQAMFYDINQQARKIAINGLYGASGSPLFRYYNVGIASSITAMGRQVVRANEKSISKWIHDLIEPEKEYESYCLMGDTDSCSPSTMVEIKETGVHGLEYHKTIPIGDLFDLEDGPIHKTISGQEIKEVTSDLKVATMVKNDQGEYEKIYSPVKYIMKHDTNKEMFEVRCGSNSVEITEDHSVMVEQNGNLKEARPECIREDMYCIIDAFQN